MSQWIWAVISMPGLGMQVLALNSSGGKRHALICINVACSTSNLLWALKLTKEKTTHFLRCTLECFPHHHSIITKKEHLSAWHFPAFEVAPKYFICYRVWNGMARKSCLQDPKMLLRDTEEEQPPQLWVQAVLFQLPLSPSRSHTELIEGTCPKENPVPCSAMPSVYHHVTHSTGALQTPQFSNQLLRALPSSAAHPLNF